MQLIYRKFVLFLAVFSALCIVADAQSLRRELSLKDGATIEIINRYGRVEVTAESAEFKNSEESEPAKIEGKASFSATSDKPIVEGDVKFDASGNKIRVEVAPAETGKRIDLTLVLPARTRLKIETSAGEAKVSGEFESVEIRTETGTIAADVPLENIRYDFVWTESRPRFLSQVELEKVEEKSAGKFAINGKIINGENPNSENAKLKSEQKSEIAEVAVNESEDLPSEEEPKSKKRKIKNRKPFR
jgi:hypothetical protein